VGTDQEGKEGPHSQASGQSGQYWPEETCVSCVWEKGTKGL
jgi:hypothetical protein